MLNINISARRKVHISSSREFSRIGPKKPRAKADPFLLSRTDFEQRRVSYKQSKIDEDNFDQFIKQKKRRIYGI